MRIPKSLKIGCHVISVVWDEDTRAGDEACLGKAESSLNRISLRRCSECGEPMPESVIADTFLHEVLHLMSSNYGIGLTEEQVAGVAGGLLDIIRSNNIDFRVKR
jgi:hypothetical protein